MQVCYLGIGSNLGDRRKNIRSAVKKIEALKGTKVIKLSKIIETEPAGGPVQGKFLNAALKIKTDFSPLALLKKLKIIEKELGRPGHHTRYSPRPIDLDILLYGGRFIDRKGLRIPHPKMFERDFVMRPLLEII